MTTMIEVNPYYARQPVVTHRDTGVEEAYDLMRRLSIRHLPVMDGRRPVGIVSDRDLLKAIHLEFSKDLRVEDVMTSDPQTARRSTPVLDVVRTMMDQKIGSVLVVDDNRDILGLFTTADALRVLEDLLDGDSGDGYYRFYLDDYVNQGWRTSLA